jgi:hypothetical protein
MNQKQRKLLTLRMAVVIIGITLVSITLFSIILYLSFSINIQMQSCTNSPNCRQEQKQIP